MANTEFGTCPYVTSQKLLAGKWTILIFKELRNEPKRFNELMKTLGITQTSLSALLKQMMNDGLIDRQVYAEVPPHLEYYLTPIGKAFEPVLQEIEKWGNTYIDYLHHK